MSEWISVEDRLPDYNEYVLVHLTLTNWGEDKGQYHDVAYRADESGTCNPNNEKDFGWRTYGPMSYFGQEVDKWMPIQK